MKRTVKVLLLVAVCVAFCCGMGYLRSQFDKQQRDARTRAMVREFFKGNQ